MLPYILIAMQAAGMVVDWFGKENQKDIASRGLKIELAGIDNALTMTRLQTEDASTQAIKNLRSTLGSQAAILAARGGRFNPGFANEAFGNYAADERMRRFNQKAQEYALNSQKQLLKLHAKGFEAGLDTNFWQSVFNKIPTTPEAYKTFGDMFKSKGGASSKGNVNYSTKTPNFASTPYQV